MGDHLILKGINKSYGKNQVLHNFDLTVAPAERIVLLGKSGVGKTTLLKIVAGLEASSAGQINISARKVGMVFQEPRLIPWRTVRQNLQFVNPLGDVDSILANLRLKDFADYYPKQLSGGMQQRVNLGRALIIEPDLLILDEAFTSLDILVKMNIISDMMTMWSQKKCTILAVTHDLKEALCIADRILIIAGKPGKIKHDFKVELGNERNFYDPKLLHMEGRLLQTIQKMEEEEIF